MKKKVLAAVLCFLMSVSCTACGKSMREQAHSGGGGGGSDDSATSAEDLQKAEENFVIPEEPSDAPEEPDLSVEEELPEELMLGELPKAVIQTRTYYEFDYDKQAELFNGKTDGVVLAEESRDQFPKLYDALLDHWKTVAAAADESAASLTEDARSYYDEDMESGFGPFTYYENSRISLARTDERIFSYSTSFSNFTGGAHGYYGCGGNTFDSQTGELLTLSDVVVQKEECAAIVGDRIMKDYPEVADFAGEEAFREIVRDEINNDVVNWEMEPDGIVFFFNPYDLASYADGMQVIKVTYAEAPEIFADQYLPIVSGQTISSVPGDQYVLTDLTGDGEPERISVERYYDQDFYDEETYSYFMYGAEIVMPDGSRTRVGQTEQYDNYFFDYKTYVIRWGNGSTWLMIKGNMEDDYTLFYIYDISGGKPELVNKQQVYPKGVTGILSENDAASYGLTDPSSLCFSFRYDRLSTFFAGGIGQISELDGSFLLYGSYAYIPEETRQYYTLKSVKAFSSDIVTEDGEIMEKDVQFPVGTEFTLYRTNFEPENSGAVVDATLSDGRIARLYYDNGPEGNTVNGINEIDLFEMLYYAG